MSNNNNNNNNKIVIEWIIQKTSVVGVLFCNTVWCIDKFDTRTTDDDAQFIVCNNNNVTDMGNTRCIRAE